MNDYYIIEVNGDDTTLLTYEDEIELFKSAHKLALHYATKVSASGNLTLAKSLVIMKTYNGYEDGVKVWSLIEFLREEV